MSAAVPENEMENNSGMHDIPELRPLSDNDPPDFVLDNNLVQLDGMKPKDKPYMLEDRRKLEASDGMDIEIKEHIRALYGGNEVPRRMEEELLDEGRFWKKHTQNPDEIKQKVTEVKQLQDLSYRDNREFLEGQDLYGKAFNEMLVEDWVNDAILDTGSKEDLVKKLSGIGMVSFDLNGLNALNKHGVGRENAMGDKGLAITADLIQNSKAVEWLKQQGGAVELKTEDDEEIDDADDKGKPEHPTKASPAGIGGDEFAIYYNIPPDPSLGREEQIEKNNRILATFQSKFLKEIAGVEVNGFIDYSKPELVALREAALGICKENNINPEFKFKLTTSMGFASILDTLQSEHFVDHPAYRDSYTKRMVKETARLSDEAAMEFKLDFKARLAQEDPFLSLLYAKGDVTAIVGQVAEFKGDAENLRSELKKVNPAITDAELDQMVSVTLEDAVGKSPTYQDVPEADERGVSISEKIQQIASLPKAEKKDGPQWPYGMKENIDRLLVRIPTSLRAAIDRDVDFCLRKGLENRQIIHRVNRRMDMIELAYRDSRPSVNEMYNGDYSRALLQDKIREVFKGKEVTPESLDQVVRTTMNLTGMKIVNDSGDHSMGDEALSFGARGLDIYSKDLWFETEGEVRATATSERGDRFGYVFDLTKLKDKVPYKAMVYKLEQELRLAVEGMHTERLLDWNSPKVKELADVLEVTINPDIPFRLSMIPGSASLRHAVANMDISQYKTFDEFIEAASGKMFEISDKNMEVMKYQLLKPALRESDPQKYLSVARNKMDILENERARYIKQKEIFQTRLEQEKRLAQEKAVTAPAVLRRGKK